MPALQRVHIKLIVAALFACALALPLRGDGEKKTSADDPPKTPRTPGGHVVVRFCDSSTLKMRLQDDTVEVTTKYGKLRIPVAEIAQIEFATRISPENAKRIEVAITNLGSKDFDTREAATAELASLGEQPYAELLKAVKSSDQEVVMRAKQLIEKIKDTVPEELLEVRPNDVIHTADSKISGRIEGVAFKASTTAFGDVPLKFAGVRSLKAVGLEPEIDIAKLPLAPNSMYNMAGQVGKTFIYRVVGTNNGTIYGTDQYTVDSHLATAAVHAGVVKVGETGMIKVTIIESPPQFISSSRNGVGSHPYGQYVGAYKFSK